MIPAVFSGIAGVPLGFQQLTMNGSAQSLTIPPGATAAAIVGAATFTWRDDGTAPTTSVGMVWPANVPLIYAGTLSALEFIAASGAVNVSYYG